MSRASKVFLASSAVLCGTAIWGVHWLQERESDTMYQGVIKDEARMRAKAVARSAASTLGLSSSDVSSSSAQLPPPTAGPSLLTGAANTTGASASLSGSGPVTQPPPVISDDCETCHISPPPQLLQAQSAEQRRAEREAREREYNEQKGLAARLRQEQGQSDQPSGTGRVVNTSSNHGPGRLV